MRLPELTPLKARREIINRFAGYNHRDVILDGANNDYASGEWYDCNKLTSDKYPTAAVRGKKGTLMVGLNTPSATELFNANGNLGYVSADSVYIKTGDTYTGVALPDIVYTGEKRVVTMGAYVIVFPHKFYVNSADLTDKGAFGGTFRAVSGENSSHQIVSGNYLNVKTCLENGTEISPVWLKPANPSDGAYWCDDADGITYKYHSDTEQWVKVETYQKFMLGADYSGNDSSGHPLMFFSEGDAVVLHTDNISGGGAYFFGCPLVEGNTKIAKCGTSGTPAESYIMVKGPATSVTNATTWELTVSYGVPDMDYVIECQNRLWGCKYGYVDGEKINEIYASALGSFKEWHVYEGTSMDSYTASIGTDGPFTGAIKYNDNPIFIKERFMHKVYGSYPAQYQINTVECAGIEDGSWKSVAVNNGVAYWHSPFGIMAYDGSSPVKISDAFGSKKYKNGVGGFHNGKYYVSLQDEADNEWHLFVYDSSYRFWLKEDCPRIRAFCTVADELYMSEKKPNSINYRIRTLNGSEVTDTDPVSWFAETGDLGLNSPDRKYVSRLTLRLKLAVGTWVKIWLKYDDGGWEWVGTCAGYKLDTFSLPVSVKRCDHFRLKLEGCGDAQIYSITRTVEGGSDL